ncbi:MAG: hypothetical protein PHW76_03225 [Alphaproteobacteria bacterium]|nr:hypothetical protein [Alphaproteobacteria bacterium]
MPLSANLLKVTLDNGFVRALSALFFFNRTIRHKIRGLTFLWIKEKYKDYTILHPPQGQGEIFLFSALFWHVKKEKPYAFIAKGNSHAKVAKLFGELYDVIEIVPRFHDKYLRISMPLEIYCDGDIKKKNENMRTCLARRLGLPPETPLYIPQIDVSDKTRRYFAEKGFIEGKTVIISPLAQSYLYEGQASDWIDYAKLMVALGYKVVFNSPEDNIGGYPTIFLPIREMIEFTKLAGNLLAFRSGLCDVLCATARPRSFIVYPTDKHEHERINPLIKRYNIKDIFGLEDIKEIVYGSPMYEAIRDHFMQK